MLRISILIPCFNVSETIDRALSSIIDQTYQNWEAIVVNDGSTDDTLTRIRTWAGRDKRIRIIDKPNSGYGGACNCALSEAQGEYIAILEPDDYVDRYFFEKLLSFADNLFLEPDIIRSAYWRVKQINGKEFKFQCAYRWRIHPSEQPCPIDEMPELLAYHPSIWSGLYRRSFLLNNDIWFKEYPGAGWADNPFLIDTHLQTNRIAYLDEPFYFYFENDPERDLEFERKNPLIPLQRWQTMQDKVKMLGRDTPSIRYGQTRRALIYCYNVVQAVGLSDPEIFQAVYSVLSQLYREDVLSADTMPSVKRLYAQVMGYDNFKISQWQNIRWFSWQLYQLVRTSSLKMMFGMLMEQLKKRFHQF